MRVFNDTNIRRVFEDDKRIHFTVTYLSVLTAMPTISFLKDILWFS